MVLRQLAGRVAVAREIEIIQDVLVFAAQSEGADLRVDLYGGASNVCGSVCFAIDDPSERATMLRTLQGWARDDVTLTYVSDGSTVTLQHDQALFGSRFA